MEKINAKYIRKCITSASIFGFLTYVLNSGIGYSEIPIRIFNPPEIVVTTLSN